MEPLFAGRADGLEQAAMMLGELLRHWGEPYEPVRVTDRAASASLGLSEKSANVFLEALAALGELPLAECALVAGLVAGAVADGAK